VADQHANPDALAAEIGPSSRARKIGIHAAAVSALILLTVLLSSRGITDGGFRHSDASRHAMDGVFMRDFAADLPASAFSPLEYALSYYARSPSLGIMLYYPPFFATVEGVFFAIFGISVSVARLTVVAFGVLGTVMMYKLGCMIANRSIAILSTALFVAMPTTVFWSRQVMLEIPTTAMILTATYFFYKYAELGHRRSAIWTALLVVAAVMTKQTALFIAPAFLAYLLIRRRWGVFKHWQFWVGAAIIAVVLIPYFAIAFRLAHYLTRTVATSAKAMYDYKRRNVVLGSWVKAMGMPLLIASACAAGVGLVWEIIRPRRPAMWLLAALVAMFFAESVYVRATVPRYAVLIFPFVAIFIPALLDRATLLRRWWGFSAAAAGVLVLAGFSYAQPVPVVRGYRPAVEKLVNLSRGNSVVLFDGYWDGEVVFLARQNDPSRHLYVFRGSKMLYTFASFKSSGFEDFITTRRELLKFVDDYGIQAVAIEDREIIHTEPGKLLREVLNDGDHFELVGTYPITALGPDVDHLDKLKILVYAVKNPGKLKVREMTIPLPGLRRVIHAPINGWRGATLDRADKPPPKDGK